MGHVLGVATAGPMRICERFKIANKIIFSAIFCCCNSIKMSSNSRHSPPQMTGWSLHQDIHSLLLI